MARGDPRGWPSPRRGLTRPEGLGLLAVVAAPAVLLGSFRSRAAWRTLGLVTLVTVLAVAPWVVRNRVELDGWVLSTNGGKTLLGSNCADTYAGPSLGGFSYDLPVRRGGVPGAGRARPKGSGGTARTSTRSSARIGRRFIDDHRREVPKVVVARVARMWGLAFAADQRRFDVEEGRHPGLQHIGQWLHLVVLGGRGGGVAPPARAPGRERPTAIVLLGPILLVTATCLLIYGGTRMRTGAEPSLAVLAAVPVASIAGARRPPAVACAACMKKIGILVVAYNAASTLAQTLDRIPSDFVQDIHEVLVGDDASQDSTHLVALGYQQHVHRAPAHHRPPPREPRLRRQPEVGLPVRHRARAGTSWCSCTATASTRPSCSPPSSSRSSRVAPRRCSAPAS